MVLIFLEQVEDILSEDFDINIIQGIGQMPVFQVVVE